MKKEWMYRIIAAVLFCFLAATLPTAAQDTHQDNHQDKRQQEHGKPAAKTQHTAPRQQGKPGPGRAVGPEPARTTHTSPATRPSRTEHVQTSRPSHVQTSRPEHVQTSRPSNGRQTSQRANSERRNTGARPSGDRGQGHRPAQWGHPPSRRESYSFRSNDRAYLRRYYGSRIEHLNRGDRPIFRAGGYFPYVDIDDLSPLPPDLYGYLPPPPPGYQMGYYDGYVVVYDPVTYFIANVIDLLQ